MDGYELAENPVQGDVAVRFPRPTVWRAEPVSDEDVTRKPLRLLLRFARVLIGHVHEGLPVHIGEALFRR